MAGTIVWFRHDLRTADHPALAAALARGQPVIPVFVWAPREEAPWSPGSASRWWLHHSLESLTEDLGRLKLRLILRVGATAACLKELAAESGADAVYFTRRYEPAVIARDRQVETALEAQGVDVLVFPGHLLHEPWEIRRKGAKENTDGSYRVYTPFSRACLDAGAEPLLDAVRSVPENSTPRGLSSAALAELNLRPDIPWDKGFSDVWTPGCAGAQRALKRFLKSGLEAYASERDRPDRSGTSRLSPHLHFGEISPRQVWQAVTEHHAEQAEPYLRQLIWREFAHHLLSHNPRTPDEPLRPEFAEFPWRDAPRDLKEWQRGRTGYPIVDAGMRELWATGWMHNRVRMIVASFLVKDLLQPWQAGAAWFWDTLVDADLANNTLGWQWVAGCGADAAPFFRIFNPVTQGEKFDPDGAYVCRWVPELAALPAKWIHKPWLAPESELSGVRLGETYPEPIVDHAAARKAALEALASVRTGRLESAGPP